MDYLHCVLGVVKMLMEFWFKTTSHGKPFYIGKKVNSIINFFSVPITSNLFDRICCPYAIVDF